VAQQVQYPERRSGIDKIMQGLQVAQSVYGIKSAYDQNKLNEIKMKQVEQDQEAEKRRSVGEFTESEVSNLYKVPAGTKGSSIGYVQKIERTPQGKAIYDEETGTPKTTLEQFHYIGKEPALIQSYLDKQAESTMRINDMNIRARGGIPISDINNGKVKNWSLKPDPLKKQIQSFYVDPTTMQETPIWISPETAKAVKFGEVPGKASAPDWAKKDSELLAGWSTAIAKGIENPSPQQALEHSPKFLNKKLTEYQNSVKEEDVNFLGALERFDREIGIDYAVKNGQIFKDRKQNIPGVTDASSVVPTSGTLGYFGRRVVSPEVTRNQAAIAGVINLLLQKRSGAAINKEEAGRLANELNSAAGNNDAEGVRRVMADLRDKAKAYYETKSISLPPSVKQTLKDSPTVPSPYSPIFRTKENLNDEDAADIFMGGK
jgi:hypothetical protein